MNILKPDKLSGLPLEVLGFIVKHVSKTFYVVSLPYLYEEITVVCQEGFCPTLSDLRALSASTSLFGSSPGLAFLKNLHITSRFRNLLESRCYHNYLHVGLDLLGGESVDSDGEENEYDTNDVELSEEDFVFSCHRLGDHSLRSFSWNLGTCVPLSILGSEGYLPTYQRRLEHLSLITDQSCMNTLEGDNPLDLSQFANLRTFSWIGLRSKDDLHALRDCLRKNAEHLQSLSLDLIEWDEAEFSWIHQDGYVEDSHRPKNFFATEILNLHDNQSRLNFSSLEILSLSAFSWKPAINELSAAFHVSGLRKLRLWNCQGTLELLESVVDSGQVIRLESLEIVIDAEQATDDEEEPTSNFLRAFSGLRDLYLLLPIYEWDTIADGVKGHLSTLKRLVFHSRSIQIDDESDYFEEQEDCGVNWSHELAHLFEQSNCEMMGIGNPPKFMQTHLAPLVANIKCKVLHLRTSGDMLSRVSDPFFVTPEEVRSFAEWAFGPDGLPELQVFAYGDFSCDGFYKEESALFCRADISGCSKSSFQRLTSSRQPLWNIFESHLEALGACAFRTTMTSS